MCPELGWVNVDIINSFLKNYAHMLAIYTFKEVTGLFGHFESAWIKCFLTKSDEKKSPIFWNV